MNLFLMICAFVVCLMEPSSMLQASASVGHRDSTVKTLDTNDGWKLLVNDQPYFIKGVLFTPVKIGETPEGSLRDWMTYDDNHNGLNDIAFETTLQGKKTGDFQLMKDLGVNTIRLYHVPSNNPILGDLYKSNPSTKLQFDHAVNKELLRKLTADFGIRVIMGNFLGSWTIGSGASWDEGTDYTNPQHRDNIRKSVQAMVEDNKDEPYVLMWYLGNENNIADWSHCNAKQQPEAYAKLIGELAQMIHRLDPHHPVAVSIGDAPDLDQFLKYLNQYAPEVDIIAYNAYKGMNGFEDLWDKAKNLFDRPVFISEFGTGAYNSQKGEDESWQEEYIKGCWKDIVLHSAGYSPQANSIGGVIFDWVDRWYMDGSPNQHNGGSNPGNSSDGMRHEEWFGITSMGDGSNTLIRQPRKICNYLRKTWTQEKTVY